MSRSLAQVALIGALLVGGAARANPLDAFGFGSRAAAMGGAATAASDDSSANYYNPAGLVRGRDLRIDIGYRYAQPLLKLNGRDLGVDASSGFAVGIASPGHIGPFRFAFGVALWLPDQRLTRVRSLPYQQPRFVYYDNRMQRFWLSANLAIQIVPGLYIGGGLTFMSRTTGTVRLMGDVAVSDPDSSTLVTNMNVDLVAVRYPEAGILWDISPRLSIGASYRHSFLLTLDQGVRIDGDVGEPGEKPIVAGGYFQAHTVTSDLFQPWELTIGAAARLTRRLLMTYDLTYAAWSAFPVPAAELDLSFDIKQFNDKVHLPAARTYPPPGFHDIVIPRIGGEYLAFENRRLDVFARGGYSYEPSPAPEQIGESNLADSDKHTFSIGAGITFRDLRPILNPPEPISIDLHLALTYLPDRVNQKLDPLDPVGDFVAGGTVVQAGIMLRTRF